MCAALGTERTATVRHKTLGGKPEEKRWLGRPKHRWKDGLKWILDC
jgi:hypothetical protein